MSQATLRVALVGNPNCGKTALFNQLTGSSQKVANYAGVTIERKEGRFTAPSGRVVQVLDLPGAYSFEPTSPDEKITRDVLLGNYRGEAIPDLIVCVANATNLRLHLRFLLELRQLGRPIVLALNMMDAAKRRGIVIDVPALQAILGVPVVETIAVERGGAKALIALVDRGVPAGIEPSPVNAKSEAIEASLAVGIPTGIDPSPAIVTLFGIEASPANATPAGIEVSPPNAMPAGDVHQQVRSILAAAVITPRQTDAMDDALDRWALHPVFGLAILAAVMFLIFQAVYSVGKPMTDAIADLFGWMGGYAALWLPDGPLRGLVIDGVFGGLGTVLGFVPEILILFLFILILEESGYLPRAAFLLDRIMVSVGMTGRSFIPLLSSFACAIPGIMGARSINDPRDRLVTILVAPLMTCSARLPVYALVIGAFIPTRTILGIFNLQGLVLFALYLAGILGAMAVGWLMKRARRDKTEHSLIMELPSYRLPRVRDISIGLWMRAAIFLKRLTGVILAITVLMWFISVFPGPPAGAVGPAINYSFAGYIGRALQFIFSPLGFTWQVSLSLIPAFAARETAVATLATVYAVAGDSNTGGLTQALATHLPLAGALSFLVWFAFAPQCSSTLAVIRRETQSWRVVAFSFGYMFVFAYGAAFITYQIARWLA
jgi:ferrous iron transport protein B